MNCKYCGSNLVNFEYKGAFACGTLTDRNGWYHQTNFCKEFAEFRKPLDAQIQQLTSKRDALQARVTTLQCSIDQRWEMMRDLQEVCGTNEVDKAVEYIKGLKARVTRLEDAGDNLAHRLKLWKMEDGWLCDGDEEAFRDWQETKESKP